MISFSQLNDILMWSIKSEHMAKGIEFTLRRGKKAIMTLKYLYFYATLSIQGVPQQDIVHQMHSFKGKSMKKILNVREKDFKILE